MVLLLISGVMPPQQICVENPNQQEPQEEAQYTQDNGFEAVVNVGIVWDFVKFIETKGIFYEIVYAFQSPTIQNSPAVHLLSYFQNLYSSSIVINAP